MRVDCFLLFDELDMLEIRLNSLSPYVDLFVLCESVLTFSGNPKPLHFQNHQYRFSSFPIIHVIADGGSTHRTGTHVGDSWGREYYQREVLLLEAFKYTSNTDIILLSDVDEIPDLEGYQGQDGVFHQKLYYYYLNCWTGKMWRGTVARMKRNIKSVNGLRDKRKALATIGGGWHFSTLGSAETIIRKIEAFSHQEHNTEDRKGKIEDRRRKLEDPYDRYDKGFSIESPSGPAWLLSNLHLYPHLWYGHGHGN